MDYNYPPAYRGTASVDVLASAAMKRVYLLLTIAMAITGVISYYCGNSLEYINYMVQNRWVMWALIIAQFVIIFAIGPAIRKIGTTTGTLLFFTFSVIMALWIAPIFAVYTHTSIAKTFFITAGTFGAMSIYGYTTKQDLTRFGSILIMCLFGVIIASLVNIFLHSTGLEWIISIAGVLIFIGLIAWDTQNIKRMAETMAPSQVGQLAVIGALSLYLDFVNLFLFLLRIFGNQRD